MSKYLIPDGMSKAADVAISKARGTMRDLTGGRIKEITLESAIEWWSKNPIVPTEEQLGQMSLSGCVALNGNWDGKLLCAEWQRRVLLVLEPEMIGEETVGQFCARHQTIGEAVIEAYRRGKESK